MKRLLYAFLIFSINVANGGCCGDRNSNCCKPVSNLSQQDSTGKKIKNEITEAYAQVVDQGSCCNLFGGGCCSTAADLSEYIGYSKDELDELEDANLGVGCGNPVSLGDFKEGFTILDLGSGAGLDCFLAAKKVGSTGLVIGVDMTPTMINKARENALKYGIKNVEFRLGYIEDLPVATDSVDIIMSNCVINLSTNKKKVFEQAYRVLKKGGKMYVSDVVLTGELTTEQKNDTKLLCACVSGALPKAEYLKIIEEVGLTVDIIGEDTEINKKWFNSDDLPISSLKFVATKK